MLLHVTVLTQHAACLSVAIIYELNLLLNYLLADGSFDLLKTIVSES